MEHSDAPDLAAPRNRDSHRLDVVMVARFVEQKDHATVLRATQQVPGMQLTFVGDGPTFNENRRLATSLGIADRVHFLGARSDVEVLLRQSDAFVLASRYEGFPLSTLEAMRAGLPTLISAVGGAAEAVLHGQTGFVFPRANHLQLARYLRLLADSPGLRESMGIAARQHFLKRFTLDRMYAQTLRVLTDAYNARQ